MDPVTHGLAGGLVAKSGLAHRLLPEHLETRGIALTAIAALAPDIDAIVELGTDPLAFLRYHRGLTHSLLGGLGVAAILAVLVAPFFPGVPRKRLLVLTSVGVYIHVLLDLLTSYGTMLLYPFRSERFTLDWMWTFDPTFLGILLVCLLGVYLLRRAPRRVAKVGLGVAVGYVLVAGGLATIPALVVSLMYREGTTALHLGATALVTAGSGGLIVAAVGRPERLRPKSCDSGYSQNKHFEYEGVTDGTSGWKDGASHGRLARHWPSDRAGVGSRGCQSCH